MARFSISSPFFRINVKTKAKEYAKNRRYYSEHFVYNEMHNHRQAEQQAEVNKKEKKIR